MDPGETDPELRRVIGVVYLDDGVTLATDADVSPPSGSMTVTFNGLPPVPAAGHFVGNGDGEYYYEFAISEIPSDGFAGFLLDRPGYAKTWFMADVGQTWAVGETTATKLRLPIFIRDDQSPPQLVTSAATVTASGQLQSALNNVSFTDASGTLHFVATGLHYYQGVSADAAAEGAFSIRWTKAGYQEELAWTPVTSPTSPASLVSISPTPGAAPGDPGGFPAAPVLAATTPVQIVISNAVPNLAEILVTFTVDGDEEIAYYAGLARGRYAAKSIQFVSGAQVTLNLARDLGWSQTAGSMLVTVEGVSPTHYTLLLPTSVVSLATAPAPVVADGAIDHAQEMLDRLPRQFKGKLVIEAFVRVLCRPIQQFENAMVGIRTTYGLPNAFGERLRQLARVVVQPSDGFSDENTLRRFISARIAANRSSGTIPEMIVITRLILASPATDVDIQTRRRSVVLVTLLGVATDPAVVVILLAFLRLARVPVRIKIRYLKTAPVFRFGPSGPGFGVGHFISSTGD